MTYERIDNKLIVLNSEHGKILNAIPSYNSHILFEFPPLVNDDQNIIHNSITIDSVEIPHSFYNIDQFNNKINIKFEKISLPSFPPEIITNTQIMTIPIGNYNANTFKDQFLLLFTELFSTTPIMSLNKTTGIYLFNPLPDDGLYSQKITFLNDGSTCFDVMGLAKQDKVFTHHALPIPQAPQFDFLCNFLGTKKINIYSEALASHNITSDAKGECSLIASVSNSAPMFGLIHMDYIHTGEHKLKVKTISEIDIQLKDEHGHLLNFNNLYWTLTINLITHTIKQNRNIPDIKFLEDRTIDLSKKPEPEKPKVKQEKEPLVTKTEKDIDLGIADDEDILFTT